MPALQTLSPARLRSVPAATAHPAEALLAVELELMRTPAFARLNGARRREVCAGILDTLADRGMLTGSSDTERAPLRLAA